MIYYINIFFLL